MALPPTDTDHNWLKEYQMTKSIFLDGISINPNYGKILRAKSVKFPRELLENSSLSIVDMLRFKGIPAGDSGSGIIVEYGNLKVYDDFLSNTRIFTWRYFEEDRLEHTEKYNWKLDSPYYGDSINSTSTDEYKPDNTLSDLVEKMMVSSL